MGSISVCVCVKDIQATGRGDSVCVCVYNALPTTLCSAMAPHHTQPDMKVYQGDKIPHMWKRKSSEC